MIGRSAHGGAVLCVRVSITGTCYVVDGDIPRGRELSRPLEPSGNVPIGAFQMFFPHGDARESSVSVPLLLSEAPLE